MITRSKYNMIKFENDNIIIDFNLTEEAIH